MKRGSDLEDPVRAVAIPRPDARGIVTGGGEVALRAVVDLAEKRLEYQLVKHTFV